VRRACLFLTQNAGYVESLAEPGGNATGFMMFEYDLSAKWLELLKRIAPTVTRAAVLRDAAQTAGIGQFAVIQSVARSVGIDVKAINLRDAAEIERAVAAFARTPNSPKAARPAFTRSEAESYAPCGG
jgi:putative ABC transport system substrate-binding protein